MTNKNMLFVSQYGARLKYLIIGCKTVANDSYSYSAKTKDLVRDTVQYS